jgi:cysteine desulfurase/selenocysteine lyase
MKSQGSQSVFFPTATLAAARALFPHTRKGLIFLNHAGTSPLSTRVIGSMHEHLRDRSEGKIDTYLSDVPMVARTKGFVTTMINAESPDRIAFSANTTDAINSVATGLPWKAGDRVLLNSAEFPANVWPYLHLRRLGVEIDIIPSVNGVVTPDMIEAALTKNTKLVGLSAVQFLSGYRADLEAIGQICRQRDVVFTVDAIQAVGAVRIDVQRMNIDALSAGGQKWQMGPHGTGFLYITEQLQSRAQHAALGWLAVQEPWEFYNFTQPVATTARRYEPGSLIMPSLWGMHAALSTLLEYGPAAIESHLLGLTGLLRERLASIPGITVITPAEPERRAGIVTVKSPAGVDPNAMMAMLAERKIVPAVREGKVRYSPHFYNTPEEMETVAAATRECIASLKK